MANNSKSDSTSGPSSSTGMSSVPILISRPGQLEGLTNEVDLGVRQLEISESSSSKRRRRRKRGKTLQNSQSFSSSLPTLNTKKDVTDARHNFAKPSVTDARSFRNTLRRQSAVEPPREPTWNIEARSPVADVYFEEYNMNHPRRGVALILNHVVFQLEETRDGSDKDCAKLSGVFKRLGFEVRVENDLTLDKVLKVLRNLSQEDHSLSDCLMVAVLTHGSRGELYAHDHTYEVDKLWMNFTADRCPTLAGKPKIFIIQACRGERYDPGTVLQIPKAKSRAGVDAVDASGGTVRYAIPNHADIIVANATVEGYYAWRNPSQGAWFIQTLCDILDIHCETRDLQTILTFVACRVAIDFESDVPRSPLNKMKQIPCVLSMLTRLVYFRRKNSLKP